MKLSEKLEQFRLRDGSQYATGSFEPRGFFTVPGPCGRELKIIAGDAWEEEGVFWDHVSVSLQNRCPNWEEMCFVKSLFFDPEDAVFQLHPPQSKWINNHPYCLHLWRPTKETIPLPLEFTV